jgi:hypothetical protein
MLIGIVGVRVTWVTETRTIEACGKDKKKDGKEQTS